MKEKLQRFMTGRYGVDDLSRFILYVTIALMVINLFLRNGPLNALLLLLLVLTYFRMFSKNHQNRYRENTKFLQYKDKVTCFFEKEKNIAQQKKIYRIYTCPSCKQKIRIPKGKGKVCVTCPKCRNEFIKRS